MSALNPQSILYLQLRRNEATMTMIAKMDWCVGMMMGAVRSLDVQEHPKLIGNTASIVL